MSVVIAICLADLHESYPILTGYGTRILLVIDCTYTIYIILMQVPFFGLASDGSTVHSGIGYRYMIKA